jgi:Fe-Mn family superoxide dismutase
MNKNLLDLKKAFIQQSADLPLFEGQLHPWISKSTMYFHSRELHNNYGKKSISLLKDDGENNNYYSDCISVDDIIVKSYKYLTSSNNSEEILFHGSVYKNVSQFRNHELFFFSLGVNITKSTIVEKLIIDSFGSIKGMTDTIISMASNIMYGYIWIMKPKNRDDKKLILVATKDADSTLIIHPTLTPLICIDIWEHSYFIDYNCGRQMFLQNIINHLINWNFLEKRYNHDNEALIEYK